MKHHTIENLGIGTDIIKIDRFKNKPYSKNQMFYKKLFLMSEIKYCLKFKNSAIHFAGKFAIKEAVKKSIYQNISFLDIETYYLTSKPKIKLKKNLGYNFLVSMSHEKEFAIATVVSKEFDNQRK